MERFYMLRLLSFAHRHLGHLRLAKHFLYPGWDTINMNAIQKNSVKTEFFVPSAQSSNIYVVNSEIGTCTCPIVSVKFHISTFNFLPSLASNDRMIYAYIALVTTPQDLQTKVGTSNNNTTIEYGILSYKESNENVEIVDISAFTDFLEEVRRDYQDGAAKLKSIPRLTSFLYDLNRDLDPMVNLRSEGSGYKCKLPNIIKDKENLDLQNIPSRKTRKA
ncbi:10450_t:CDS:2, partial [Rhizophagus irregularis]